MATDLSQNLMQKPSPSVADRLLGPVLGDELHTKRTLLYKVVFFGSLALFFLFEIVLLGIMSRIVYEYKHRAYYFYNIDEALIHPMVWHLDDNHNYVFYCAISGIIAAIMGLLAVPTGLASGIDRLGRNTIITSSLLFLVSLTSSFLCQMISLFIPLIMVSKFTFTRWFYPLAFTATLVIFFSLFIQSGIQLYFSSREVPEKPSVQPVTSEIAEV
jgi:uncharacterized membrane protein